MKFCFKVLFWSVHFSVDFRRVEIVTASKVDVVNSLVFRCLQMRYVAVLCQTISWKRPMNYVVYLRETAFVTITGKSCEEPRLMDKEFNR